MRLWMPLATAVVITWPIPSSAAPATRVLPPSLATAAASYDHAQVVGDRVMLERLLADDYLLVNGAAERESKRQLIADLTDSNFHLEPFRVEGASQVVWSDGAVLAGEVHLTGLQSGKPFKGHIRFADVWRRDRGQWHVVFTQVTRFPSGK